MIGQWLYVEFDVHQFKYFIFVIYYVALCLRALPKLVFTSGPTYLAMTFM